MRNVFTSKKASDTFTAQLLAAVFAGLGITSPDVAESIAKGKRFVVNTDLGEMEGRFDTGSSYAPERPRTYSVGWVHFRFRDSERGPRRRHCTPVMTADSMATVVNGIGCFPLHAMNGKFRAWLTPCGD